MGVVSEVLGNHGAPHRIEHNGKMYPISRIDQRVKSGFEEALFMLAKRAIKASKDLFSAEEYSRRIDLAINRFETGDFEIFSKRGLAFLKTTRGFRTLLSLMFDIDENEVLGILLAEKDELVPMVGLILRESFPGLTLQLDPKAVTEGDEKQAIALNLTGDDTKENASDAGNADPNG